MAIGYVLLGAVIGVFIMALFNAGGMEKQLTDAYNEGYKKGQVDERDRIWAEIESKYGKK